MTQHRKTAHEWLLLFTLSVLWGGSFFFYKVLVAELPPVTVVLGRMAIATAALHVLLAARGAPFRTSRDRLLPFLLLGLLNNVIPFSLIAFGETRIASGLAAILNATTPLFTVVVAHVFTNDRLTPAKLAGLVLGLIGVAVLTGPDLLSALGGNLLGQFACLAAALTYGFGVNYGRRFRDVAPLTIATGQATASIVWLIPLAALVDRPWALPPPSAGAWAALAGIGLFGTAIAYILFFRLMRTAGPTNLVLVTLLAPVSALLLGAAFLNETVTLHALGGMAVIGLSLAAIDGRPWEWVRGRVAPSP